MTTVDSSNGDKHLNGSHQQNGNTPASNTTSEVNASFLRAARAGNLEKVLEFLNQNIDINVSNSNGLNALHLASKEGHVHVVRELLERSADVNAATKKGNTALHIASLAGQQSVVELLVKHGANVDCRSQNGFTPLYMAAQENHVDIVKFLLANHANQSLATEDGFTPLAVALQQGHEKVVAILLENDSRGKIRLPALHIAAKKNDVKAAALLLNNDPSMDLNPEIKMVNCTTKAGKSGFTPLHIAAHYGNAEIAKFLIAKGADVNYEARQNITPLHVATKWGRANSVNLLLDSNAKIDVKTRDGLTPLHCAARSGHDQIVELLINRNAPINVKTKNGLTALHMAAQGDHVEAARILLYHSAKLVDQTTCDFLTALHVAAHCGHVKIAKLLLDHKADVNSRALNGFTPLHIACKKNRLKVIELLIKHGASKEATTESGLTPLHVASFMGCMNVVVFLIQHGAQPNVPTIRGETPLHLAARANQTDIVRILLRHGAAVDAKAKEQQTPLHIATRLGNTDIIALLLRHGAFVDAATSDGYTALHIASKEGQEEVAGILFENGASLNVTTKKGFTPLHIASKYGNVQVASLLLQRKAQPDVQGKNGLTPLHVATHYNRPNVANLLLQHQASPHIVAKNGYSALHIAAKKNQMDIAQTLLQYGAKTNCESNAGFTPLHLACQEGHLDMSELLLENKADSNSASKNGLTPLHLCAQEDKVNCAAGLVKHEAQIDPQTKAGYTPLHVACHFGQINMVKFLLQFRADVNIITKHGFTSLHCAAQQGHVQIVKLLLEHGASPNIQNNSGQTPLAIAQRLGYISVIEELKLVTQTTLVSTTIKTTEEKYKVQTPETMQETFMSDSEDELGDEAMFGDAEHYKYLTNEADLNNVVDDSIALTPKTPKREDTKLTAASPQTPQVLAEQQQQSPVLNKQQFPQQAQEITPQQQQQPVSDQSGGKVVVGSLGNMSMAESADASYYNSVKNVHALEADNIPVESRPKAAGPLYSYTNLTVSYGRSQDFSVFSSRTTLSGVSSATRDFLISFMVDARGGAMKGCRHSGVRVIIPPKRASMPTRITCRFVRKDKLALALPLNEGEALAARVLEMGPQGYKFLGPVLLEIPHYGSMRGREREVVILRSDTGEKWYEHPIVATEQAVEEALGCTLELTNLGLVAGGSGEELQHAVVTPAGTSPPTHHTAASGADPDSLSTQSASKLRITRIITNDFPKYFALVSRVRHETHAVSEVGGVISSTIVPKAQAVFPEKALQKKIKLSLQAMPIPYELVAKLFGNRVAVSPIVTIEPRRRKFHKAITLTIPLPKSPHKGMINSYGHNNESFSLRLLCSITGGLAPAQWEDITGHTPLSYIDECVSFTTTVSARFWLMDCQNVNEATKMATELYREAIAVPFMSRFIVYAKRHDLNESKLRVYCITDDKEEKTLELRENFVLVAKSKEVEVLENRIQWLEMGGNIAPASLSKSTVGLSNIGNNQGGSMSNADQLSFTFQSFLENRLPFTVRVRDQDQQPPSGRLVFLKDPKNAQLKSDVRSPPVCTLDIQLPPYNRELIEHDELRKKNVIENGLLQFTFLNGSGMLTATPQHAKSTNSLLYNQQADPNRIDFNLRLLANDLNNADRSFDWTQLAGKLNLNSDEVESIRHMSSSSPLLLSASPANQTYDMLTVWMNKFSTSLDYNLQADSGPGELLLKALREMGVEEEIISRNMTSASPQHTITAPSTGLVTSGSQAENVYSVEKSLAKLNLNLSDYTQKPLPTYEDKDIIKDPDSTELSDNDVNRKTILASETAREIVEELENQAPAAGAGSVTITAEEHIHQEPNSITTQTIINAVIGNVADGTQTIIDQHIEETKEYFTEEQDEQQQQQHDLDYIDNSNLPANSSLLDSDYCKKINQEYEAIKNSVLNQRPSDHEQHGQIQSTRLLTSSLYDNLGGGGEMMATHEDEPTGSKNTDYLSDIIAQVMRAQSQTEQLERIDYILDNLEPSSLDITTPQRVASPVISPSVTALQITNDDGPTMLADTKQLSSDSGDTVMQIIDPNYIIINEVILPPNTETAPTTTASDLQQENQINWDNLMMIEILSDQRNLVINTADEQEEPGQPEEQVYEQVINEYQLDKADVSEDYDYGEPSLVVHTTTTTILTAPATTTTSSVLRSRLEIDLSRSQEDEEAGEKRRERAIEHIEQQSPIIERELLTQEHEIANLKARLEMSDAVSAVTQQVLDSIRKEYNLQEPSQVEDDDDEETRHSSSNEETVAGDVVLGDEDIKGIVASSSSEDSSDHQEAGALSTSSSSGKEIKSVLQSQNEEMKQKIEIVENKLQEIKIKSDIETFTMESQHQIEKIMMIHGLDVEGEELDESENSMAEVLMQQKVAEQRAQSSTDNENDQIADHLVGSVSGQMIVDAHVEPEPMSGLLVNTRKLSISQTRLLDDEEGVDSEEAGDNKFNENEDTFSPESTVSPTHRSLNKSKQYQTFESSSSANSDLNKQDDFSIDTKTIEEEDHTAAIVITAAEEIRPDLESSSSSDQISRLNATTIPTAESSQQLLESMEAADLTQQLLLTQDEEEEEEILIGRSGSIQMETPHFGNSLNEDAVSLATTTDDNVSVGTVVARQTSAQEGGEPADLGCQRPAGFSSMEISSEADETDEENNLRRSKLHGEYEESQPIDTTNLLDDADEESDQDQSDEDAAKSEEPVVVYTVSTIKQVEPSSPPSADSSNIKELKSSLYLELDNNKNEVNDMLVGYGDENRIINTQVKYASQEEEGNEEEDVISLIDANLNVNLETTNTESLSVSPAVERKQRDQSESPFQNSSNCSQFSISTTSEENLVHQHSTQPKSDTSSLSNEDEIISEESGHGMSKSLNYLASLVVPSTSTEFKKNIEDFMSQEAPASTGLARPTHIKMGELIMEQDQTPTPVENMMVAAMMSGEQGGSFFDKRVSSSNEPSLDIKSSSSSAVSLKKDDTIESLSNELLRQKEISENEINAAMTTAIMFSSTVKSQSSDELLNSSCSSVDNKPESSTTTILTASTKYIVLSTKPDEETAEYEEDQPGVDNLGFQASNEEEEEIEIGGGEEDNKSTASSTSQNSMIINQDYDDTEDQIRMNVKVMQSSSARVSTTIKQPSIEEEARMDDENDDEKPEGNSESELIDVDQAYLVCTPPRQEEDSPSASSQSISTMTKTTKKLSSFDLASQIVDTVLIQSLSQVAREEEIERMTKLIDMIDEQQAEKLVELITKNQLDEQTVAQVLQEVMRERNNDSDSHAHTSSSNSMSNIKEEDEEQETVANEQEKQFYANLLAEYHEAVITEDQVERTAMEIVSNTLSKSMEMLISEQEHQQAQLQHQPSLQAKQSILKASSPTSCDNAVQRLIDEQLKSAYSPKEVRFSSNLEMLSRDVAASELSSEATSGHETMLTSDSLLLDTSGLDVQEIESEVKRMESEVDALNLKHQEEEDLSQLQAMIINSNYKNTFSEINNETSDMFVDDSMSSSSILPPTTSSSTSTIVTIEKDKASDNDSAQLSLEAAVHEITSLAQQHSKQVLEGAVAKSIVQDSIVTALDTVKKEQEAENDEEKDKKVTKKRCDPEDDSIKRHRKDDDHDDDHDDSNNDPKPDNDTERVLSTPSESQDPSESQTGSSSQETQQQDEDLLLSALSQDKPLLTSSFMSTSLPGEVNKDLEEDRLSSKTLEFDKPSDQDLNNTIAEMLMEMDDTKSTSSYFTATSSIQPQTHQIKDNRSVSITTNGSNYLTAVSTTNESVKQASSRVSTATGKSDSFHTALVDLTSSKSSNTVYEDCLNATQSDLNSSLNSSYSALNDLSTLNSSYAPSSHTLSDNDDNTTINEGDDGHQDDGDTINTSSTSNKESTSDNKALGQFNVEYFLKNMHSLVAEDAEQSESVNVANDETKKSENSSNETEPTTATLTTNAEIVDLSTPVETEQEAKIELVEEPQIEEIAHSEVEPPLIQEIVQSELIDIAEDTPIVLKRTASDNTSSNSSSSVLEFERLEAQILGNSIEEEIILASPTAIKRIDENASELIDDQDVVDQIEVDADLVDFINKQGFIEEEEELDDEQDSSVSSLSKLNTIYESAEAATIKTILTNEFEVIEKPEVDADYVIVESTAAQASNIPIDEKPKSTDQDAIVNTSILELDSVDIKRRDSDPATTSGVVLNKASMIDRFMLNLNDTTLNRSMPSSPSTKPKSLSIASPSSTIYTETPTTTASTSSTPLNKRTSLMFSTNMSLSSSNSSLKSTDSFENELKTKCKIDTEASFFARKRSNASQNKASPLATGGGSSSSNASLDTSSSPRMSSEIVTTSNDENEMEASQITLKTSMISSQHILDSGQSSMTASMVSQLQSPLQECGTISSATDEASISSESGMKSSHSAVSSSTDRSSLMSAHDSAYSFLSSPSSDLSHHNNILPSSSSSFIIQQQPSVTIKESPSTGSISTRLRTSKQGAGMMGSVMSSGSNATSRRQSRTSSSASSSSSISDCSRLQANMHIHHVLSSAGQTLGGQKTNVFTAEDLPSFRNKQAASPLMFNTATSASTISTSRASSKANSNTGSPTTDQVPASTSTKKSKPDDQSNSGSAGHIHHSSNCYCGKKSTTLGDDDK